MDVSVLRPVRTIVRADSDPVREALFQNVVATNLVARMAVRCHRLLGRSWASGWLVSMYGLKSFAALSSSAGPNPVALSVAVHANAARHVRRLAKLSPLEVVEIQTRVADSAVTEIAQRLVTLLLSEDGRRALRLIQRVNRQHSFLVACRVASTLACYARFTAILRSSHCRAVLVSSDSNPEEVALCSAARRAGVPTVFVSHAYTTSVSPPLDFSLAILEGEASQVAHAKKGTPRGRVLLAGVEGTSRAMDSSRLLKPHPSVGIFAPKAIEWPVFRALIEDCRRRFGAREILIRWHPSMLEQPDVKRVLADASGIIETPRRSALEEVATRCDWVVADVDSNVHLPTLKLGVPTVSVKDFGIMRDGQSDIYGFVRDRVIYPAVASLSAMAVEHVVAFYSGDWEERFRRYDAGYMRVPSEIDDEVREALTRVMYGGAEALRR